MSCLPAQEDAGKQPDYAARSREGSSFDTALDELRAQLGDDAAVERFQQNYLALLDERIIEITEAMRDAKHDVCITRLLTLETSSHMVGAEELSLHAAALRLAIAHRKPEAGVLLNELTRAARMTRDLLSGR